MLRRLDGAPVCKPMLSGASRPLLEEPGPGVIQEISAEYALLLKNHAVS